MSLSSVNNADFNIAQLLQAGQSKPSTQNRSSQAGSASTVSFLSSLAVNLAGFESRTLDSLMSSVFGADGSTAADALPGTSASATDLLSQLTGRSALSASGRNSTLFDPESGYRMMTDINNKDLTYIAQFSELSQMQSYLIEMQEDGESLGDIDATSSDASIKAQLQTFTGQYNDWIKRFDADMQSGGLLAGTQAAQVSLHELDQSVDNIFNGASDGLHGLADLGISIDPATKLASFDGARLDAVLATNKHGVVATVQQFSANFAKSAELLNSAGNFIPSQLDNLNRAIRYIDSNSASLQAEFGTGQMARPTAQVAQALAAYDKIYAM